MNFLSIAQNRYTTNITESVSPKIPLTSSKKSSAYHLPLSTANLGNLFSWVMSVRMRFLRLFP